MCTHVCIQRSEYLVFLQIGHGENDTVKVLEALGLASTPTSILHVLSDIHGPWSFVFWQVNLNVCLCVCICVCVIT